MGAEIMGVNVSSNQVEGQKSKARGGGGAAFRARRPAAEKRPAADERRSTPMENTALIRVIRCRKTVFFSNPAEDRY
jgi:hypothetical protein